MTREQEYAIRVELEKTHIEEKMPTFRGIPLREFNKEQLIKIHKLCNIDE